MLERGKREKGKEKVSSPRSPSILYRGIFLGPQRGRKKRKWGKVYGRKAASRSKLDWRPSQRDKGKKEEEKKKKTMRGGHLWLLLLMLEKGKKGGRELPAPVEAIEEEKKKEKEGDIPPPSSLAFPQRGKRKKGRGKRRKFGEESQAQSFYFDPVSVEGRGKKEKKKKEKKGDRSPEKKLP